MGRGLVSSSYGPARVARESVHVCCVFLSVFCLSVCFCLCACAPHVKSDLLLYREFLAKVIFTEKRKANTVSSTPHNTYYLRPVKD